MRNNILIPFRFPLIKEVISENFNKPVEFTYGTYNFLRERKDCNFIFEQRGKRDTFLKKILGLREKTFSKIFRLGKPLELYYSHKETFKNIDIVFCINDAISFAMLHCKKKKLINCRVITLFQSLSERYKYFKNFGFAKKIVADLLEYSDTILVLSSSAKEELIKQYSILPDRIKVFHFCIDEKYWQYREYESNKKDYILTIGNDLNRDYTLLGKAVDNSYPVTAISKKRITNKHIKRVHSLSFEEVRECYYKARFTVIPIKKVYTESSGLSCTLQAMACGCPVIIADSPPMRELFVENEDIIFYEPGNRADLKNKIEMLWNDEDLVKKLAKNGYKKIKEQLNYACMEEQVGKILGIR